MEETRKENELESFSVSIAPNDHNLKDFDIEKDEQNNISDESYVKKEDNGEGDKRGDIGGDGKSDGTGDREKYETLRRVIFVKSGDKFSMVRQFLCFIYLCVLITSVIATKEGKMNIRWNVGDGMMRVGNFQVLKSKSLGDANQSNTSEKFYELKICKEENVINGMIIGSGLNEVLGCDESGDKGNHNKNKSKNRSDDKHKNTNKNIDKNKNIDQNKNINKVENNNWCEERALHRDNKNRCIHNTISINGRIFNINTEDNNNSTIIVYTDNKYTIFNISANDQQKIIKNNTNSIRNIVTINTNGQQKKLSKTISPTNAL